MSEASGRLSLTVETRIQASLKAAWSILVDPVRAGKLFWDQTVVSDFTEGHPIVWKGTWDGKPFEDKGTVLQVKAPSLLQYSHWAPSSGADVPENRSILTWRLSQTGSEVRVSFQHENIPTQAMKDHSEPMWKQLLAKMKDLLEAQGENSKSPGVDRG